MGDNTVNDERRGRRGLRAGLIGGGLVAALAAGYVGTAAAVTNKVPDGTRIAGVEVGGMSQTEAENAIAKKQRDILGRKVTVTAEGKAFTLDPAKSGLGLESPRGLDGLAGFSLAPGTVKKHLFGDKIDRPLKTKADVNKLSAAVTQAAGQFEGAGKNGSVKFVGGKVQVTRSTDGTGILADDVARQIAAGWPGKTTFNASVGRTAPPLTNAEIDAFVKEFATPAMSGPVTVKIGEKKSELTTTAISDLLSAPVVDGAFRPTLDKKGLADLLDSLSGTLTTPPVNAHYGPDGSVVEAKNGTEIDSTGFEAALLKALTASDRTVEVKTKPVKAAMTAADLKNLGTTKISEFVSKYPGGAENAGRTKNIQIALSKINGTVIAPGEQFSLLKLLTPIEKSNGYVDATVLVDGMHATGVGGGISQVSTTVYNAAFFAGVQLDEHTPHSYWIPRYPMGREATLWVPTIDNKWTNDTGRPIRIEAGTANSAAYVRFIGTKTFDVSTTTSPQYAFVQPKTRYIKSPDCQTQDPAPGFSVRVTRTVKDLSGKVVKDESEVTNYIASDRVVCG